VGEKGIIDSVDFILPGYAEKTKMDYWEVGIPSL